MYALRNFISLLMVVLFWFGYYCKYLCLNDQKLIKMFKFIRFILNLGVGSTQMVKLAIY